MGTSCNLSLSHASTRGLVMLPLHAGRRSGGITPKNPRKRQKIPFNVVYKAKSLSPIRLPLALILQDSSHYGKQCGVQRPSGAQTVSSIDHMHEDCLQPTSHCVLLSCPLCYDDSHDLDGCKFWLESSSEEQVEWLVVARANKPAWHTQISWYQVLKNHLLNNPEARPPQFYPWTVEFAKQQMNNLEKLQEEYDKDNSRDPSRLPVDPATKDWLGVWRTFERLDGRLGIQSIGKRQRQG